MLAEKRVGDYDNGSDQLPLAEHFDGTDNLAIDVFPTPSGAQTTELTGISCASASSCVAVGYYSDATDGSGDTAFAAALNGWAWSLQTVPVPSGSVASALSGVSCPTSPRSRARAGRPAPPSAPPARLRHPGRAVILDHACTYGWRACRASVGGR